jgi:hypothetical protein
MAADEGESREPVTKEVRLLVPIEKSDDRPKRVSYGVVLEPDTEDLQGDVMTAEDIEAAAYDWMERSQAGGHMHTATIEGAKVVESYIAPCDIPMETAHGRETIRKGSWVLAMRWPEEIWESIAKGDLTGYSVGGTGVRLALEHIGKKGKWAPGPNAGWRLASGGPRGYATSDGSLVTVPESDRSPARPEDEERDEELRRFRRENRRRTAEDAYAAHALHSFDLIDDIDERLQDMPAPSEDFQPSWGDVGDATETERQLTETLGFLTNNPDAEVEPINFKTPEEAYGKRMVRNFKLVEQIREALQDRPAPSEDFEPNWGHAGSAAEVARRLKELQDFLRPEKVGKKGKWAPGPNAGWRLANGDPAADGAAAEGGGTPADQGAAAARRDAASDPGDREIPWYPITGVGDQGYTAYGGGKFTVYHEDGEWVLREGGNGVSYSTYDSRDEAFAAAEARADASDRARDPVPRTHPGPYERPSAYGGSLADEDDDSLDGYPSGTVDDEDRYPTGGKWAGEEGDVDLLDLFDGSEGTTVTLDGHAYTVKEIRPFKYTRGLDAVVLEPKDKNSEWYREARRQLRDDWYHEISDPDRLVEVAAQLPGGEKLRRGGLKKSLTDLVRETFEQVIKDKGWAPGPNAGWRRITGEDGEPKKHTTRDGVVIEDQPKVTRVGGEQYQIAKPEGQVILNFGEWKWTGTGKSPKVTERGSWAVWPRHKKHNLDNLIRSSNRTLAELMRDLPPGEYDLAP